MTGIPQHIRALEAFAHRCGVRLRRAALPEWLHGRQGGDQILVRNGLPPEQELRVLVHELTHWLVHRERQLLIHCTIYEYEAEAVEAIVMRSLGVSQEEGADAALLAHSARRVAWARDRICAALGLPAAIESESQSTVDVDAASGEEIVLEDEQHGVCDFLGLTEPT